MKDMTRLLLATLLAAAAGACGDDGGSGDDTGDDMPPDMDTTVTYTCVDEAAAFAGNNNMVDGNANLPAAATNITAPDFTPTTVATGGTPGAGFDAAGTHIGALGNTDWTEGWTAYPTNQVVDGGKGTVEVGTAGANFELTGTVNWDADNTYILKGPVFVTGTLNIEAGTVIKGDNGSALVVTQDGDIQAVGTVAAPIVFTSSQASGSADRGDWGGVVLLGSAPLNTSSGTNTIEGFAVTAGNEELITYGGDDAASDCGTLNYVRIEYAGFELSADNELNGLTIGGCGTGTSIDYVQVHRGLDDGIEIFGGTVNVTHAVVTLPDDDGFDLDLGWTGKGQYWICQQENITGDRCSEDDSNSDDNDATPRTRPEIWNYTFIGGGAGGEQGGIKLRVGAAGVWRNGIIFNFEDWAVDVDGASSAQQVVDGNTAFHHTIFEGVTDAWPAGFDDDDEAPGGEDDCLPDE